jgi:hypothetical protein
LGNEGGSTLGRISENLNKSRSIINEFLHIGYAKWDDLIARLENFETKNLNELEDEQLWTFLLRCGYAASGADGVQLLSELLTGEKVSRKSDRKIWFEVLPIPPRENEGNTHLDLAIGDISLRDRTCSGIVLSCTENPWVCFCEMKWNADISTTVSYDVTINQLIRVIENAICFQSRQNQYADAIYVTMVTPAIFDPGSRKSRLYQYKFEEYSCNASMILSDIQDCALNENKSYPVWKYPTDLVQRISCLKLNWISFEQLFENLLPSVLKDDLSCFWNKYRKKG